MAYIKGMIKSEDLEKIITKKDLQYLILLGQRSNGKSYAVKERAVKNAYEEGREFVYLRRYEEDIREYACEMYFADLDVSKITKGEFDALQVFRKKVYFSKKDENGEPTRCIQIGYIQSLNKAERAKSLNFGNADTIIYEEFITENTYLNNEPDRLMNFVSTVFRNRMGVVCLVGNTISRICPYYGAWGLIHVNTKQKPGSVDIYSHDLDDGQTVNIGVYRTDALGVQSGMFFGKSNKMISKGEYYTENFKRLDKPLDNYNICYSVVYKHDLSVFLLHLISDYDNAIGLTWYCEPKTTPIKDGSRVIANNNLYLPKRVLWTATFKGLNADEQKAFDLLDAGYIVFNENLTGTEFYQCLKNDKFGKGVRK